MDGDRGVFYFTIFEERSEKALKEQLLCVQRFENVQDLDHGIQDFLRAYNDSWIVQRHSYSTLPKPGNRSSKGRRWPHDYFQSCVQGTGCDTSPLSRGGNSDDRHHGYGDPKGQVSFQSPLSRGGY